MMREVTVPDAVREFCAEHGVDILVDDDDNYDEMDWTVTFDGNHQRHLLLEDEGDVYFEATQIGEGPTEYGYLVEDSLRFEDSVLRFTLFHYDSSVRYACTVAAIEGSDGFLVQTYED